MTQSVYDRSNYLPAQQRTVDYLKRATCMFWDELKVALSSLNILVSFDIKDVLFGILDTDNTSILVNYILLESKYFIYRCKLNKGS